jgi:CubicO group peptidase (beta-lactamase class C family)
MAVSAKAQGPAWSLDPNKQALTLPTGQTVAPAYMDAPDGNRSVPFVINPGAQRNLDLFYRLPPGQSVATNVTGFQLNWQVAAGERVMAMQTPFARETIDVDSGPYVAVGVATPWWWYRPYWWGPWGPYYGWGWGYGYGYGWGWRRPGVYHPWPAGGGHGWPGAGHGGGWRGGGGHPVRGAPIRH